MFGCGEGGDMSVGVWCGCVVWESVVVCTHGQGRPGCGLCRVCSCWVCLG